MTGSAKTFGMSLTAALLVSTAMVQPAASQDFKEALASAYANNSLLRAQRAAVRVTDESVPQALAGMRPTASLNGDVSEAYSYNSERLGKKSSWSNPYGVDFQVVQKLYDGYQTDANVAAAESSVLAERARLTATEQNVLLSAAAAYVNVLRDAAVLELNINNEQVLRRQLEATRDRFEVGELTRTDVSQAEARHAKSVADRIQSEGTLRASLANFDAVVGAPAQQLSSPGEVEGIPASLPDAVTSALKAHPSLIAARHDEDAGLESIKSAKGAFWPTVNLSGRLSRDWDSVSNGSVVDNASVTAAVSVPLYQAGSASSKVRQTQQNAQRLAFSKDAARDAVVETAKSAWEAYDTAKAQTEAFHAQINASEVALDGVQREAQVGSRTVLDVLDAEQELLDAKVNLVRAERDKFLAAFQVRESIGTLTAQGLGLSVELYDPTAHYKNVRDMWYGGFSE